MKPLDLTQFTGSTPGKWTYHDLPGDDWCISTGPDDQISVVAPNLKPKEKDGILIAAAPDLLAECKRLKTELKAATNLIYDSRNLFCDSHPGSSIWWTQEVNKLLNRIRIFFDQPSENN